ncbi:major facilitator superfamily protein-related [Holotrichia oblita]|uniref:Major facilitator superfamily protein-related n=2 Tax=Holotrichia oblita TaxID=644536 RepID=A0ACB9SH68_HOLOL|nr:major facilitator superfamily protein-related [Holotrichia oblita]KAI4454471.1 major facilitator superfamily protein-related [Holotrichia oblita]
MEAGALQQEDPVQDEEAEEQLGEIKLYRIRWLIISIFVLYAAVSSLQWVQYSIITNIIVKYYGVSSVAVDWTSMISMVTYPPLLLPASYMLDKMGLRFCALIGVTGTAIGTWIKMFSAQPDLFYVGFIGQTVVFVSQLFILSLPPKVASVWFGPNEVSTACSLGVFGTQLGTALSFIVSPLAVRNHDNLEDIGRELSHLFYGVGAVITPVVILVFIFFKAEPTLPPSIAQAKLRLNKSEFTNKEFLNSYKSLLTNKPFMVLMFAYGINIGVFAALGTMLNQFVLSYFANAEKDAGTIGLLQVVIGCLGVVVFGVILDKTKRYKEVNIVLYVMTILGIIAFMAALETYSKILVYISGCGLGFFQNAYYAAGLEFGVELSFPQPESSSSGVLISMSQICGTIFTLLLGKLLATVGAFWALSLMVGFLAIGILVTVFIPNILLRQKALGLTGEDKVFLPKNNDRRM